MKKNKPIVTMEMFQELIEDPKTNHTLLFTQMMDHLQTVSKKKFKKTLKEIGNWVDMARYW